MAIEKLPRKLPTGLRPRDLVGVVPFSDALNPQPGRHEDSRGGNNDEDRMHGAVLPVPDGPGVHRSTRAHVFFLVTFFFATVFLAAGFLLTVLFLANAFLAVTFLAAGFLLTVVFL